jgi:hypothetical protein
LQVKIFKEFGWKCSPVIEYMLSMYKALGLMPSTKKEKKKFQEAVNPPLL